MNGMKIVLLDYMRGIMTIIVMLAHVNLLVDREFLHGIFVQG